MECRQFREFIVDNPRRGAYENAAGGSAYAHAAECELCSAWLAAEDRLAEGFELVRRQDELLEAPAGLETALVEKFRSLHTAKPRAMPVRRSRRILWGAAAAAALAVGAWLSVGEREPGASVKNSIARVVPDAVEEADAPPRQPDRSVEPPAAAPVAPGPATGRAAAPEPAGLQAGAREMARAPAPSWAPAGLQAGVEPAVPAPAAAPADAARNAEVVTEFVPLTYAGTAPPFPGARLVRVRLPSTALAYFGLPGAAASPSVDADVLLGDNGLAYAVRFVRPAKAAQAASNRADSRAEP